MFNPPTILLCIIIDPYLYLWLHFFALIPRCPDGQWQGREIPAEGGKESFNLNKNPGPRNSWECKQDTESAKPFYFSLIKNIICIKTRMPEEIQSDGRMSSYGNTLQPFTWNILCSNVGYSRWTESEFWSMFVTSRVPLYMLCIFSAPFFLFSHSPPLLRKTIFPSVTVSHSSVNKRSKT